MTALLLLPPAASAVEPAIATIAGTGQPADNGSSGKGIEVNIGDPFGVEIGPDGALYIADISNHRIRRLDAKTGIIDTIAGNGEKKLPIDGQQAIGKPMLGPRALFIERGMLWIALREGHSVWKMDLESGTLSHIAGSGKQGFTGDGGPAKAATFDGPKGIAIGPDGNVYVMDTENHAARKIDLKTSLITTIAGMGPTHEGGSGDGGPAAKATMNRPHGICVGGDGAVYIGDTLNHRVRRVK